MQQLIYDVLAPYQKEIQSKLEASVESLGEPSRLRDACLYALTNGGKRFRPSVVLMIGKALNSSADVSDAALAIEYFHTASLIADDLPCMDDDSIRRDSPSLHIKYDQATALLASYALIAAGYEFLARAHVEPAILAAAIQNVSHNIGICGATTGQYLDLFPPNMNEKTLRDVIYKKTVTLFEVSFVLGWLYGGGDPQKLSIVKKAAYHFGMAFQIADDFGDSEQDMDNGRIVNVVNAFGKEKAGLMFNQELAGFKQSLTELNLAVPELLAIGELLESLRG